MNEISIRAATPADTAILDALAWRLAAFELPPWRTAQEIADADGAAMAAAIAAGNRDDEVLLAERDGAVVGCLHVLAPTDFFGRRHAHISVIATTDAAQGSGVGRALMVRAEEWAAERRLTLLTLNVFAGNGRARRFYEAAGYTAEMVKYAKPINS